MRDAQDVIRLGRKVRSEANHKLRQPLAEVIVSPRNARGRASIEQHSVEIAAELNVKGVRVADRPEELIEVEVVPNFRALGPRLGKDMPMGQAAAFEGQYTRRDGVIESATTSSARATSTPAATRARATRWPTRARSSWRSTCG